MKRCSVSPVIRGEEINKKETRLSRTKKSVAESEDK